MIIMVVTVMIPQTPARLNKLLKNPSVGKNFHFLFKNAKMVAIGKPIATITTITIQIVNNNVILFRIFYKTI